MDKTTVIRWVIALSALVGAIGAALLELEQLTWSAAVPAVLLAIGAWVAKSPWDVPKRGHVAIATLPMDVQERLKAKKLGR